MSVCNIFGVWVKEMQGSLYQLLKFFYKSEIISKWKIWTSPNGSVVKEYACNAEDTQKTWVWSVGWKEPLEKEMAPHSSILAWKIPWAEGTGGLHSMGSQRVGHEWATKQQQKIYIHTHTHTQKKKKKESSTPQFQSINSSMLSFLYSPTLTSIHDYWKNHSFD